MLQSSAPGKLILCGEHAVVYGQPAIAVPVTAVAATATLRPRVGSAPAIVMPDLDERWLISDPAQPLGGLVGLTLEYLGIANVPDVDIVLTSMIPIASGMGSGAALGAALVQVLGEYYGTPLAPEVVSTLVYESERGFHGTPSGIDNTVVSFARPIWYQRRAGGGGPEIAPLAVGAEINLVIGDTGTRCPTRVTVGGVRERWQADPTRYERYFAAIGDLVRAARVILSRGDVTALGAVLDENHSVLQEIGVSSPELDRLVEAAHRAGALGAKLSGGGGGGIMLALGLPDQIPALANALRAAGATRVIPMRLTATAE